MNRRQFIAGLLAACATPTTPKPRVICDVIVPETFRPYLFLHQAEWERIALGGHDMHDCRLIQPIPRSVV